MQAFADLSNLRFVTLVTFGGCYKCYRCYKHFGRKSLISFTVNNLHSVEKLAMLQVLQKSDNSALLTGWTLTAVMLI
jgi:hypothetical protein